MMGAALRALVLSGSLLFALGTTVFIAYDGRERMLATLPWIGVSVTALTVALPAFALFALGLDARYQTWTWATPLTCLNVGSVPLAAVTLFLYTTTARNAMSRLKEELTDEPSPHAEPQPYYQAVCRNPGCRSQLEPEERYCRVCGWDQTRPVPVAGSGLIEVTHTQGRADGDFIAYLVVRNGSQAGANFRLGKETDIGSGPGNQIVLDDPFISLEHATIRFKRTAYVLYDMSDNGSFLVAPTGKQRLDIPYKLRHGDMVEMGDTILVFMQTHNRLESGQTREETHVREN